MDLHVEIREPFLLHTWPVIYVDDISSANLRKFRSRYKNFEGQISVHLQTDLIFRQQVLYMRSSI